MSSAVSPSVESPPCAVVRSAYRSSRRGYAALAFALIVAGAARTGAAAQTEAAPLPAPTAPAAGPPAGIIPDHITVTVSGDPAAPAFLAAQIGSAVAAAIRPTLAPGAVIHVADALPAPQPLGSGFLTEFRVPVTIDPGAGETAVAGTTSVGVVNAGLAPFDPFTLSFKDDPERITASGVLSRTTIDAAHPVRLYYYHENTAVRRRFCVVLSANDSVRTRVQIVGASAGPNVDVMGVGHAVTKTFLDRQPSGEGVVLEIAGGKPVLERDTLAGPGEGIVGSADVRVLYGGPVTVTVMAIPPAADPSAYLFGPKLPDDGHARHGSFGLDGFAERIIGYTAGGPAATYRYGTRARTPENRDPADPGRDYGDYGVLQRVTFDLANPANDPALVYLYEKPLGGVVRSSFLVNGALTEVGCVRVAQPYAIASLTLAPHAAGSFDVLTMTDGGSNYPLEIGVTTVPPQPSAPAINAADGCFPKPGGPPAAAQPAPWRILSPSGR